MNDKYFLFWSDYDGNNQETFDSAEQLEKRYTELMEEKSGKYGFTINGVLLGKEVTLEPREVATAYKIKKD